MAKRDRRSRALLRNLRKQARKGQLTAREKKDLLEQESRFRKARRANAPYMGAGLAGAAALLGTPAGQSILENIAGGVRGLRQDALGAREDRKTFKEQSQQERDIMAAETDQELRDMMEKTAGNEPASKSQAETGSSDNVASPSAEPGPKQGSSSEADPFEEMTISELQSLAKDQGFESVQAMKSYYKDSYAEGEKDMREAERERVAQPQSNLDYSDDNLREDRVAAGVEVDYSDDAPRDKRIEAARDMSFTPDPDGSAKYDARLKERVRELNDEEARAEGRAIFESIRPEIDRLREEEDLRDYNRAASRLDEYLNFPATTATQEILSGSPFEVLGDRPRLTSPNNPISRRVSPPTPRYAGEELGIENIQDTQQEQFQDDVPDFSVNDLFPTLERVQAQGGKNPRMQDLMKRIARKYGIK
jgi:hypothetical protein